MYLSVNMECIQPSQRCVRLPASGRRFRREKTHDSAKMRRSSDCYLRHPDFKLTAIQHLITMLALSFSMVLVTAAAAQPSPLVVSAKSGIAGLVPRGSFNFPMLPRYALYVEVQLERRLVTVLNDVKNLNGHIAISGAFYGGYWNDGVGKDSRVFCTDCFRIIHSYRSYIAGMRVYANPSPFPLRFVNPFMGLSDQRQYMMAPATIKFGLRERPSFEAEQRAAEPRSSRPNRLFRPYSAVRDGGRDRFFQWKGRPHTAGPEGPSIRT